MLPQGIQQSLKHGYYCTGITKVDLCLCIDAHTLVYTKCELASTILSVQSAHAEVTCQDKHSCSRSSLCPIQEQMFQPEFCYGHLYSVKCSTTHMGVCCCTSAFFCAAELAHSGSVKVPGSPMLALPSQPDPVLTVTWIMYTELSYARL